MRVHRTLILLLPTAIALGAFACDSNDDDGSGPGGSAGGEGGEGGTASSSSASSSSSISSTTTVGGSGGVGGVGGGGAGPGGNGGNGGGSGGAPSCDGLGDLFTNPACGACLELSCCQELVDWNGADVITDELKECAATACPDDCSGGGIDLPPPECDAGASSPSAGSCIAIGGGVECNPVTNAGCDTVAGYACDVAQGGFTCYRPVNDTPACVACDPANGPFCVAGYTCAVTCYKYCCDDTDCGGGTCIKSVGVQDVFPLAPTVGVCIDGGGGAGGSGGSN